MEIYLLSYSKQLCNNLIFLSTDLNERETVINFVLTLYLSKEQDRVRP